ncbi:MAG: DUF4157 domain-containing protein [Betaproteobacteria bacterium]|nr:DUF4157 domain-containing protein [Betaproteobacteria bacterium]
MKTHAEPQARTTSRAPATPVPNALAHQAQLRGALLRAGVQPRLEIGASNDPLEREADVAAERVMQMPAPLSASRTSESGAGGEGKTNLVQLRASAAPTTPASPQLESSLNSLNSGGKPLDASSRAFFEPRFGQDFSQVRLHTDPHAAQMANSLNAQAFTLGNNIAFADNQYSAHSPVGKNLLGHELAHVVQQREMNGNTLQAKLVQREPSPLERIDVKNIVNKSQTLKRDIRRLKNENWRFNYNSDILADGECRINRELKYKWKSSDGMSCVIEFTRVPGTKIISLKNQTASAKNKVLLLAHEVGHVCGPSFQALQDFLLKMLHINVYNEAISDIHNKLNHIPSKDEISIKPKESSDILRPYIDGAETLVEESDFVNRNLASEGDAILYGIKIQKEIMEKDPTTNIGLAGTNTNHQNYYDIYEQLDKREITHQTASETIGEIYRTNEKAGSITYEDYYKREYMNMSR